MKKSYHSTVVPTTVANTTLRRSVLAAKLPVGVNAADGGGAGWFEDGCVLIRGYSFDRRRRQCRAAGAREGCG
ncbi:hypothetical protein LLS1_33040 [Leifsonia sp. LS1]|nr:hypothetical protein LLS1_33040 [Leifsonia sp. LS1]